LRLQEPSATDILVECLREKLLEPSSVNGQLSQECWAVTSTPSNRPYQLTMKDYQINACAKSKCVVNAILRNVDLITLTALEQICCCLTTALEQIRCLTAQTGNSINTQAKDSQALLVSLKIVERY
jgi:hypothetical protein